MKKTNPITTQKISVLQFVLTLLFVVCLVVSNIISAKQMLLPFDIVLPAAVIIFPITYVLSDVFSEVYGYKWSRFTCYLGFAANLFAIRYPISMGICTLLLTPRGFKFPPFKIKPFTFSGYFNANFMAILAPSENPKITASEISWPTMKLFKSSAN
jgi:hypothetical protein